MNNWEFERYRTAKENARRHFVEGDNKRILQLAFEYGDVMDAKYRETRDFQLAFEARGSCWSAYLAAMSDDST